MEEFASDLDYLDYMLRKSFIKTIMMEKSEEYELNTKSLILTKPDADGLRH